MRRKTLLPVILVMFCRLSKKVPYDKRFLLPKRAAYGLRSRSATRDLSKFSKFSKNQ